MVEDLETEMKKLPDADEHKQFKKQYKRYVKCTDVYNTNFKQEDAHRSKYRKDTNTVHCYDCDQDIKGGKAQYETHAESNKHKTRVEEIKTAMNASQHYKKKLRTRREKNQDKVETRRQSLRMRKNKELLLPRQENKMEKGAGVEVEQNTALNVAQLDQPISNTWKTV